MTKLFDTATGKSIKTAGWIVLAYALALGAAALAKYHYPVSVAVLGVPGVVNWLLYTASVAVDKEVPNFPSSPIKALVTITPPTPPEIPLDNPAADEPLVPEVPAS